MASSLAVLVGVLFGVHVFVDLVDVVLGGVLVLFGVGVLVLFGVLDVLVGVVLVGVLLFGVRVLDFLVGVDLVGVVSVGVLVDLAIVGVVVLVNVLALAAAL